MSYAASRLEESPPRLSPFASIFVQTILEHRGVSNHPSRAEFSAALDVLQRYEQQCQDNPREPDAWEPRLDLEGQVALRAKAFVMFGATKPMPGQWHKAHAALYGPLLCDTCG